MEPFKVFVENCPPLELYLKNIKSGEKPSIVSTIQKWMFDSFINAHENTSELFVLLNQKLDPSVAQMDSQDFLGGNEIWWPTVHPHIMQTVADLQPGFLKELQKTIINDLDKTSNNLNALTQSKTVGDKKVLDKTVANALGNQHPFLYILMRPYMVEMMINSPEEKTWANDIAICALQGQIYIGLSALQVWNTYQPLHKKQLVKLHAIFSSLDLKSREQVVSFASVDGAFYNGGTTELLHICQNAHITNELGIAPVLTSTRRI